MSFHKVKEVTTLPHLMLSVTFTNDTTKMYDVKQLFERFPVFHALENPELFNKVVVDTGGYGIVWSDELDLSCNELWERSA